MLTEIISDVQSGMWLISIERISSSDRYILLKKAIRGNAFYSPLSISVNVSIRSPRCFLSSKVVRFKYCS